MVHRTPRYAKLAWRLGKDPMLSKARRVAVVAAAGYLVSPVDLVPGFIPVLGQLDDLAFALAALRLALDGLHPDRRRMHLEAVGLEDAHLADDIRTVGATAAWIGRRSLRAYRPGAPRGCPRRGGRRGDRDPDDDVGRRHGEGCGSARGSAASAAGSTASARTSQVLRPGAAPTRPSASRPTSGARSTRRSRPRTRPVGQAPHELAAGAVPSASDPPSDSHACQLVPSQ